MIPMPNATTTAIITARDTIAATTTVMDTNVGTIMERASTAATRRATKDATGITESK